MKHLKPGTKQCQCAGCGEYFRSVTGFDSHRSGPYTARVCLNPAELGMVKNGYGFWMQPWPDGRLWDSHKGLSGEIS
jgi:hypothetical protein